MAEYISKADAVYVINSKCYELKGLAKNITKGVQELPPADVAPVVRCKDCEAWQTDWTPSIPNVHYCAVMDSMMKADDFCSYGEKREE